jgi:histone H4
MSFKPNGLHTQFEGAKVHKPFVANGKSKVFKGVATYVGHVHGEAFFRVDYSDGDIERGSFKSLMQYMTPVKRQGGGRASGSQPEEAINGAEEAEVEEAEDEAEEGEAEAEEEGEEEAEEEEEGEAEEGEAEAEVEDEGEGPGDVGAAPGGSNQVEQTPIVPVRHGGSGMAVRQPILAGGMGKGAKGSGRKGKQSLQQRRRKMMRDVTQGITKSDIKRLARRGGCKRINKLVYDSARSAMKEFLSNIIHDAIEYTGCARRKTVTVMDVVMSLKRNGKTLYGFGG